MLGRVTNQCEDGPHHLAKIFLVRDTTAAIGVSHGFTVVVIQINQVNVAGHIELARPQLAHANNAQLGAGAVRGLRHSVQRVQCLAAMPVGTVQRKFGQFGHGLGHDLQRGTLVAIQTHQTLHHQLANRAQGTARVGASSAQLGEKRLHTVPVGYARRQLTQL